MNSRKKEEWEGHEEQVERVDSKETTKGKAAQGGKHKAVGGNLASHAKNSYYNQKCGITFRKSERPTRKAGLSSEKIRKRPAHRKAD